MSDLISKQTRIAFREHMVREFALAGIRDIFDGADVVLGEAQSVFNGERRSLIEQYYSGVNWEAQKDVSKVLHAFEDVLTRYKSWTDSSGTDSEHLTKLVRLLRRDGYVFENDRLVPTATVELGDLEDVSSALDRRTLREHIRRIEQSIETDPGQAVGSGKELIETVAKAVLASYDIDSESFDTLQKLVTEARKCLNLTTDDIPDSTKGAAAMKQVLAGLGQIVGGIAELRNLYGTGHGRTRVGGLTPRHARLVVGSAATLARFLLDTLEERRANRMLANAKQTD